MIALSLLALITTAVAAPAVLNRFAADAVLDSPGYTKWIESAKPGDIYQYDGGAIMLEAEERLPGTTDSKGAKDNKDSKGNSTIEARRDCITRRQLQSNVDRTGLWWSAWAPIADCQTCQGGPCDLAFPWQWTGTWRVSGDWRDDGWDAVREAINNDGGKNFGYRWEKSSSTGGEGRCQAAGSQTVRLWHQVRVGWADIAQRTIVSSSNCPWQRQNGDWQFSHLDLLLEGGEAHHVGCSYDDRAECSRPRD